MASPRLRLWTCTALATLSVSLSPLGLSAQDSAAGGMRLTLGVSQSLGVTRNPDLAPGETGISPLATTNLSLGYLTETRTERLAIDLSGGLRVDETGAEAESPTLSFGYDRISADADLSLGGSVRRTRANATLSLADLTAPDGTVVLPTDLDQLTREGTLTRTQLGGTLTWGKTAPVGYRLGVSTVDQTWGGPAATIRDDSRTSSINAGIRLDVTPVLRTDVTLTYTRYDVEGSAPTDRLGGSVGLSFDRPAGAISATLTAQETGSGTRYGLQAARTFTLPGTTLTAGAGVSLAPDGGTQSTGRLAYSRELPRGQIDLALARSFATASDGSERRLTTASASYAMAVTPLSSLRIGLDVAQTRDDAGDTALSAALQAAQSFQLTPDWALSVGAETELRRSSGTDDARRDSLFVSLGRNFTWRP